MELLTLFNKEITVEDPDPSRSQSITLQINNNTNTLPPFNVDIFCKQALKEIAIHQGHVEFTFVTNDAISEINKSHLNKSYATDIISFNLGSVEIPHGDIYISIEKAIENAKNYQNTLENELKLLIIHGLLHLIDYKDYTNKEKAIMNKEQTRLLEKLTSES